MRSRAARLAIVLLAWIAIGAAATFLYISEKQIGASTIALRAFDLHAREATDALADLRAGEQAYVAAGQGVAFWMPKVAATTDAVTAAVRALRQSAASAEARASLDQAAGTIGEFADIDKRARDYVKSGQTLMAGDVIFTEGAQAAASAAHQVEASRLDEHQAFDLRTAQVRKAEALALGGAAAVAAIVLLLLAVAGRVEVASLQSAEAPQPSVPSAGRDALQAAQAPYGLQAPPSSSAGPVMKAAADLATDAGRARDFNDLAGLLARVAELMDATGVVIWIGNTAGADLRPVLAHGYSPQIVARMPAVPRSGDNAAAAAYRTGSMQLVLSRPGGSNGAIVAPILTADGCIGALSAEIRSGGETSETVQALAAIFAAQLANVIGAAPAAEIASDPKTASA